MPSNAHLDDNTKGIFIDLMTQGITAHAAGDCVKALTAFESALALNPQDTQAVSACAALLLELSRPRAAFALLQSIESQLLLDHDGCANLGLAALSCNQVLQARSYFEQALKQQPMHASALTNLGMLAAREQRWLDAISYARRCVTNTPNDETAHANLMDYWLGARSASEALQHFHSLPEQLKNHDQIVLRRIVALALNAEFEAAHQVMSQLKPQATTDLANFLQRGGAADLQNLFYRQALDAMQACDWRDYGKLCAVVGIDRLHQDLDTRPISITTDGRQTVPPFMASSSAAGSANTIRIGISAISLRDAASTQALADELSLYDTSQFIFHVYAPTPQPQAALSAPLAKHQVVEIAHFTDEEAVWRIRLDSLDIWFDLTINTSWHRPGIAQHRVAPVQMLPWPARQLWLDGIYDYALSDTHLLNKPNLGSADTALIRLPYACWTVARDVARPILSRKAAGLPVNAFIACVFGPCAHITPATFASWMQLLRAVPNAVLWLSLCSNNAQVNLRREASQAGVGPERIMFATADGDMQNTLHLADLFLHAPGSSHAQILVEALRAGVPAIAAASPLASSVLHAAGLGDCVFKNGAAYITQAQHLAQNPNELTALRERVSLSLTQSPIFDARSRASERAAAWTLMVKRSRAGLLPEDFDIPLAGTSG